MMGAGNASMGDLSNLFDALIPMGSAVRKKLPSLPGAGLASRLKEGHQEKAESEEEGGSVAMLVCRVIKGRVPRDVPGIPKPENLTLQVSCGAAWARHACAAGPDWDVVGMDQKSQAAVALLAEQG